MLPGQAPLLLGGPETRCTMHRRVLVLTDDCTQAFLATLEYDLAFTAGQLAETLTRVREAASDN